VCKTGHFYFAKNRTFSLCLDRRALAGLIKKLNKGVEVKNYADL